MPKLLKFFYLTPRDIGIERYNVKQIAEIMKRREETVSGPLEFACAVRDICESEKDDGCFEDLATASTPTGFSARASKPTSYK